MHSRRGRTIWAFRAYEFSSLGLMALWPTIGSTVLLCLLALGACFTFRWQQTPALLSFGMHVLSTYSGVRVLELVTAVLLYLSTVLSLALCVAMRIPVLPPLRGKFKVGTILVNLTDSRRKMWPQLPALAEGPRMLPTMIWYPASGGSSYTARPRTAFFRHTQKRERMAKEFKMPSFLLNHFCYWQSRSRVTPPPASPAEGTAGFPVVLFSCGWTAAREACTILAEEIAAQGFVVVSCDHVGDTPLSTAEEDGDASGDASGDDGTGGATGLLVYMGHDSLSAWHAAGGQPTVGSGKSGEEEGIKDMQAVAAMVGGVGDSRLREMEEVRKGGIGWDAAVRKHGAGAMGRATLRLQAFRRSQLKLRAGDQCFLLDALEQLKATATLPSAAKARPPPCAALAALGPALDLSLVFSCGQSFGGATAIQAAASDQRISAVLGLDPWMWTLPGHGSSIRALFPTEAAASKVAAEAVANEPSDSQLFGRPMSSQGRSGAAGGGAKSMQAAAADHQPLILRCPAAFLSCERMWRPELTAEDVFGIDNRNDLAALAARSHAPLLYLDKAMHFDLTDLPMYAPRVSAALSMTGQIHLVAPDYAVQSLMLDAFLALAREVLPAKSSKASEKDVGLRVARGFDALAQHAATAHGFRLMTYDALQEVEGPPKRLFLGGGDGRGNGRGREAADGGNGAGNGGRNAPLKKRLSKSPPPPQGPQQKAGGGCTSRAVAKPEAKPWVATLVEVLLTALLPLALVLLVLATSKRMPGKPGDDLRLHALAK